MKWQRLIVTCRIHSLFSPSLLKTYQTVRIRSCMPHDIFLENFCLKKICVCDCIFGSSALLRTKTSLSIFSLCDHHGPASETPVPPVKAPPAAKSRPRSPSQPSAARPVLRSRRSVSLSRQSDSPQAESGPRFIDVVRASLSPESGRKGTGRHSGRDQSKGNGKGKRSTSREERVPSVESVRRENIRPTQSSQAAERRHSGGKGARPESSDAARRHSGGKGKGKSTNRDAGPRPSAMDAAFDRPEYGVSSAFVYCLWMIWSGFFKFSNEALTRIYESEIYDKTSRELSWILRHSGWTHADQSLSVFELMAGARFSKTLSQWAHTCMSKEDPVFPVVQKAQVQPWCEASVERINLLLPLAITIMYNQKGRYQVGILSTSDHHLR